jgi:7-cyano-7-deazaguanine synthase
MLAKPEKYIMATETSTETIKTVPCTCTARALVILSGGFDSTTILYDLVDKGLYVEAISFDIGQKHIRELEGAKKTCQKLGVPHKIVSVPNYGDLAPSSLTREDIPVPEMHYDEPEQAKTVVPNRNMLFIALAASYAISRKIPYLFYGPHLEDHGTYPDCRPIYVEKMRDVLAVCDEFPILLQAPLLWKTKGDILRMGIELGVDHRYTWSCYYNGEKACGKCGSCINRMEAFKELGIEDPLEYEG